MYIFFFLFRTIFAGALTADSATGTNEGSTKIYHWSGSEWVQKGATIYGEGNSDFSGNSISISFDCSIVAIGAPMNDGAGGVDSGQTRVYSWSVDDTEWVQMGSDIDGEQAGDQSGTAVSLSWDGLTLAVGEPYWDMTTPSPWSNSGRIR